MILSDVESVVIIFIMAILKWPMVADGTEMMISFRWYSKIGRRDIFGIQYQFKSAVLSGKSAESSFITRTEGKMVHSKNSEFGFASIFPQPLELFRV